MSEATYLFGLHAVRMLIERHPERILSLVLQQDRDDERVKELAAEAQRLNIKLRRVAARELDQLAGEVRHQGAAAQVHAPSSLGEGALDELLERVGPNPLLLVLDGVQDPHNLGACLRTAEAVGVHAVIVPRDRAAGLSATVRKVASGAAEIVPLIQVTNLARTLRWLKEREIWIVGTDSDADASLHAAKLTGPLAVVMGAEAAGMRRLTRECCDALVSIPLQGVVESLNVSVATGVVLFEVLRQRRLG
jgi:23S rRNA (guanosine2251-2'-O)-methyltransferase